MADKRVMFRAAVFVIIRDEQGRVLLQRRAHTGYMDGYYDFPSGHVDADEGFTASVVRELREETSLSVKEADLHLKHLNLNYTDYPYIIAIFDADEWQGNPTIIEPHKCDDMQFFDVDNLPEKCSHAVRCIEKTGFDTSGGTSYTDRAGFKALIGVDAADLTG